VILNRLSGSLRRHDWPSVVVELAIVVIGILLALQVDNWNQERREAAEARVWRAQIVEDLERTRFELTVRRNYNAQALVFAEQALAGLQSSDPLDPSQAWGIVLGAFQAGQISPFQLTGPTFREVQNAGALRRVADSETLSALISLYDVSAYDFELINGGRPPYRDFIRQLTPWAIQSYIWSADCQWVSIDEASGLWYNELTSCAKPDLDPQIQEALQTFRSNPTLLPQLLGRMSQLRVSENGTSGLIDSVDELLAMFEKGAGYN
jgi:hypothetical protein